MFNGEVVYSFTVADNVSPTIDRMTASQEKMEKQTDQTTKSVDSQRISFMTGIMGIMAFDRGIRGISSSMLQLGIIGKEDAHSVQMLNSSVMLVSSSLMLLKGGIQIMNWLREATVGLAMIETYRAVLKNPAMMGLVMTGVMAGGAVAGYYAGRSATTVNQTVNFGGSSTSSKRQTAKGVLETVGG